MTRPPVLITGAAGFIGSHLTERLLRDGAAVVGVDNFCDFYDPARKRANIRAIESGEGGERFTLVEADIRDRQAMLDTLGKYVPQTVVHIAAMAGVRPSIADPALYAAVNIDGTVNMLDAAVACGTARLIFASSSSVYGNNDKVPFAESDRVDHPISPYAATKKACELICHSYSHLNDLAVTCLRFFTVFGPRQRPDLAIGKFLGLVAAGEPLPVFGDGSTSRDYTFVDDIVHGIIMAIDKADGYHIYNLGGNHPVTLSELIETIETVVGRKANIDRKPMQPGDVNRTWADLTRSQAALGYEPKTSLADGIARQWQWLQTQ